MNAHEFKFNSIQFNSIECFVIGDSRLRHVHSKLALLRVFLSYRIPSCSILSVPFFLVIIQFIFHFCMLLFVSVLSSSLLFCLMLYGTLIGYIIGCVANIFFLFCIVFFFIFYSINILDFIMYNRIYTHTHSVSIRLLSKFIFIVVYFLCGCAKMP